MEASPKYKPITQAYRWYALALLTTVYVCHMISRFSVSVVMEPIKAEFQVDDKAMGLVGGLALSIAYAIMALPVGWLVDHASRRKLLAAALALWSVLTLAGGLVTSFLALVLTRVGVGAVEASSAPTCLSLITDIFPPRQRATAISIFYTSTYIGTAIVFLVGGVIAAAFGWRAVLLFAGAPGLILALVIFFTLRDTERGASDGDAPGIAAPAPGFGKALRYLASLRTLRQATIAITVGSLAVGSMFVWLGAFLVRNHGLNAAEAGIVVAIGLGAAQAVGAAICGPIADRLALRNPTHVAFVPAAALTLAVPIGLAMIFVPSTAAAIGLAILLGLALGGWVGPGYSLILGAVPSSMRGSAIALVNTIVNVLGVGLGPLLTGALSDHFGGPDSLRHALAVVMLFNLWAAVHFLLASGANPFSGRKTPPAPDTLTVGER